MLPAMKFLASGVCSKAREIPQSYFKMSSYAKIWEARRLLSTQSTTIPPSTPPEPQPPTDQDAYKKAIATLGSGPLLMSAQHWSFDWNVGFIRDRINPTQLLTFTNPQTGKSLRLRYIIARLSSWFSQKKNCT
jgi:hypothetical protein